ncbi:hypothetical protein PPSIR1_33681 [Plesiocystis pacifica SIR-1]|uniref:Uncharacterized protein n=1 Tax=Plesiocystis pacifica SIR-1 TaxID=391625 RepID=A6GBK3_9BACT|nr:hypothetical protein [Plesiocystis pacifica]EDM76709.1 hypothetical protein PPSIR1_33681 [Plesiocystis pacifica SIR-1]
MSGHGAGTARARRTTCAIVGGVVALGTPESTQPQPWREALEALPGPFEAITSAYS